MSARRAICHIDTRTYAEEEDGRFLPEDHFGTRLPCRVRTDGASVSVSYTEKGESSVDTRIECTDDTVLLTRRGDVCFSARLEKGVQTPAPYSVGAYAFDTVCTLEYVRVTSTPLSVMLAYRMDMEGVHRKIELSVTEEVGA